MVDETTDLSNTEQMVFCLHCVNEKLKVHEEFIGLYSLESTTAESIFFYCKRRFVAYEFQELKITDVSATMELVVCLGRYQVLLSR